MTDRAAIAAMLRAGATYRQIRAHLGAHPKEIRATRVALHIPVPPGRGGTWRTENYDQIRDQVADMLRAGATARQVSESLGVSSRTVSEVRRDRAIPPPPGRGGGGRTPDHALHNRIESMLRDGATYDQIRAALGTSTATIARVRKERTIPLPTGRNTTTHKAARTPEQALAHHTQPAHDGHTTWTGPTQGRALPVLWSGGRHNALHTAFRLHHHRDPAGRVLRSCDHPGCMTGAHLTDRTLRDANHRADQAFNSIFGTTQ
ncbi:Trp family transcriptional regulator [Streptomyces adelaidensis]|uniref:Trp family transcriptional regulator n=1 Tax=Streptomyces adelaidensis TaxID=2796465 RepID=UPI001906830D|nr:Trp family transcriptional regulator [Streptomyces adelaidensis]